MDLFGDESGGVVTSGAKNRAKKVVEHWQEMVRNGVRREKGEFFGDILNPLANRVHDGLWEMGDGNVVFKLVEQNIIHDPQVAGLAYHHDVKRYVSHRLLDLANVVLMAEQIGQHKEITQAPDFMKKVEDLSELTSKHRAWDKVIERTYIQSSNYYGTVLDISKHFAIQNIGQNTMVVHDLSLLSSDPYAGQKAHIKYENGRGHIQTNQEQNKLHVLAR